MQETDVIRFNRQQALQEGLYTFPYHWLPHSTQGRWELHRYLWWGYRYLALIETVKNSVLDCQPAKVLDFGCGDGRLAAEVAAAGVQHVAGIDISVRALQFARAFAGQRQGLSFAQSWVDLEEQQFDVVAAMEVLEHINPDEMNGLLAKLHEHHSEGGRLVVSVPTWHSRFSEKHFQHFSLTELKETLGDYYRIDRHQYIHANSAFASLLQRCVVNRLFVLNNPVLLGQVMKLYRRHVMHADADSGLHLVAVATRQPA